MKLTIIIGTNRAGSQSLRVGKRMAERYTEQGCDVTIVDLAELPFELLSPGAYKDRPEGFHKFVDPVVEADGLLIIVPEYNGSYPGVLKLFIDMWPYPDAFDKRPVAFVGIAAGPWGGLRSVEHLQGVFGYRNAFMFPERLFLPNIYKELDENADCTTPLLKELVESQVKNFVAFCHAVKPMAANALIVARAEEQG